MVTFLPSVLAATILGAFSSTQADAQTIGGQTSARLDSFVWETATEQAEWDARAGLEVAQLNNALYVIGGRTPKPPSGPFSIPGDSIIQGDVWKSTNLGKTWTRVVESNQAFPPRAYHEAVTKDDTIFVLGGQNYNVLVNPAFDPSDPTKGPPFFDQSEFFSDVWSSTNGVDWTQVTRNAGWEGRAGLSAIVFKNNIFVMGGSTANDASVVGDGGPPRVYFNDVWRSFDGRAWSRLTDAAPWEARAGAAVTVKDDYLYLIGGEVGFTGFPPPYFNDVWRTADGIVWELVTDSADWSPRPGHVCHTIVNRIVCFGGFGQSPIPGDFTPSNPMDIWESEDGADWTQVAGTPWNATEPGDIKYDFDSLVVEETSGGTKAIYTFGGDRETFDFSDPTQYLNVDNDVWRYGELSSSLCICGNCNDCVLSETKSDASGSRAFRARIVSATIVGVAAVWRSLFNC